jgi:hypothetical protein
VDDSPGNGKGQFNHLPLGLADHLRAQVGQFLKRLRQSTQHGFATLIGRLLAGSFALGESFREGIALQFREVRRRR